MPASIYILAFCTATAFTCASLLITLSALIGFDLAPNKNLTTLPMALQFFAVMSGSVPASFLMAKMGRRFGFMLAACIGLSGAAIAVLSLMLQNFWLFCLATFFFGSFTAFSNFYRFAAAEAVGPQLKNRAISYVMAGGVIAAFIGPNLANLSQNIFSANRFYGAFLLLSVVYIINFLVISQLKMPLVSSKSEAASGRPLSRVLLQPIFIVAVVCEMFGYGSMNLIMSSTPLAMHAHDHGLGSTAQVIQWHIFAMFMPSFFTGRLIDKFGIVPVLATGVTLGFVTIAINLSGETVSHFIAGLVALGICWNFLFVGGTTLLTSAYEPGERSRVQAINDLLVFSFVTITALSAGSIHYLFGWKIINLVALPLFVITTVAILWLALSKRTPAHA